MTADNEHKIETYKSMIGVATEALKALQLLNGGAVIALLTYLAHVQVSPCLVGRTACPLAFFISGLFLGTLAFFSTYFTQFALYNESLQGQGLLGWSHMCWFWVTFVLALLSLIAFASGAFASVSVLTKPC
jgi:hypothetical protein